MKKLRTAVIGVGYLGRFHAQKYAQLENSELIAVVDVNEEQGRAVAEELSLPFYTDPEAVLDKVDAVSIVVPTVNHYAIAKMFLEHDIHVLLEKPFAATLEEARELKTLAEDKKLCLQIGHLERFNVVFTEFKALIDRPRFIENIRIAPFPKRGTDVDVVLDLMIHDIDLILAVVQEFPSKIQAVGVPILSPSNDLANARLEFPGGCVANLTASRVSDKAERKMRIFQQGLYLSLDYGTGQARRLKVAESLELSPEDLKPETYQLERGDALLLEITSFLESVATQSPVAVPALAGLQAMEVAWEIKRQL